MFSESLILFISIETFSKSCAFRQLLSIKRFLKPISTKTDHFKKLVSSLCHGDCAFSKTCLVSCLHSQNLRKLQFPRQLPKSFFQRFQKVSPWGSRGNMCNETPPLDEQCPVSLVIAFWKCQVGVLFGDFSGGLLSSATCRSPLKRVVCVSERSPPGFYWAVLPAAIHLRYKHSGVHWLFLLPFFFFFFSSISHERHVTMCWSESFDHTGVICRILNIPLHGSHRKCFRGPLYLFAIYSNLLWDESTCYFLRSSVAQTGNYLFCVCECVPVVSLCSLFQTFFFSPSLC